MTLKVEDWSPFSEEEIMVLKPGDAVWVKWSKFSSEVQRLILVEVLEIEYTSVGQIDLIDPEFPDSSGYLVPKEMVGYVRYERAEIHEVIDYDS
jgi:hypothetical protein